MHDLLDQLKTHTDDAEVFGLESTVNLVMFENNKLKSLTTLNSRGAAVRARVNGKLGQSFTSDLRHPATLAERIRKLAELGDSSDLQFAGPAPYAQFPLTHPSVTELTMEEILADGQEAISLLQSRFPNIMVTLSAERTTDNVQVLTTNGAEGHYERMFLINGIIAELVEGHNILRMTRFRLGTQRPASARDIAADLAADLEIGRKTVPFTPGRHRVIFAPSSLADVLMAFTGAVDADLVARGVSPLTKRMGDQILDPRLSIVDDPHNPTGILSAPLDDEGTPTQRRAIVDRGVLRSFIADRNAAGRLGISPTGNAWRVTPFERYKSFSAGLSIDFSNLVVEGGDIAKDDLYRDTQLGIEVHQINGILLGDLIGGDFSGSLEIAFLVRNGERIGRIKDAMIAGNFFSLFKDQIIGISREQAWGGIFGGVSGSFQVPWIAVDNVEIAGTH